MNTREHHRIHADPTRLADNDVLTGSVFVRIHGVVVRGDQAYIGRDVRSGADNNSGVKTLKIASEHMKIIKIVNVEADILHRTYNVKRVDGPPAVPVKTQHFLPQDGLPYPPPANRVLLEPASPHILARI
jgi:hypothetical protein